MIQFTDIFNILLNAPTTFKNSNNQTIYISTATPSLVFDIRYKGTHIIIYCPYYLLLYTYVMHITLL